MVVELEILNREQKSVMVNATYITHGSYSSVFSFSIESAEYILKVNRDWDLNELGIVNGIRHPNILSAEWFFFSKMHEKILDTLELDDLRETVHKKQMCLVFKKYTPLNQLRISDLTETSKAMLILDVITGLNYLHKQGIYHGDIKPANVLVAKNRHGSPARAILADFSLTYPENAHLDVNGSIGYSSPETTEDVFVQTTGSSGGICSDIWSLACLIIFIVVRNKSFREPFMTKDLKVCSDAYDRIREEPSVFIVELLEQNSDIEFWFKPLRVMLETDSTKRYVNLTGLSKYISTKYKLSCYDMTVSCNPEIDLGQSYLNVIRKLIKGNYKDTEAIEIPERYKECFLEKPRVYMQIFKKLCEVVEITNKIAQRSPEVSSRGVVITAARLLGIILTSDHDDLIESTVMELNGRIWM